MSQEDTPLAAAPTPIDASVPDVRTLLTTALALAREAVVLDEAQNIGSALIKYGESVGVLREILERVRADGSRQRSEGDTARVQAILDTYTSRIHILREIYREAVPAPDEEQH